jgi:uncharacterized protein YrrD
MIVTDSGHRIGRVFDIVLNTDTGKVVGFLTAPSARKVLSPMDIISWDKAMIVHDEESILDIEEIHQVKESLKKNIRVHRAPVYTKSRQYLGKVLDYAVNDRMFVLTKIIVAKTFLGIISYGHRIIAHKDILEIKKDAVIVKDPLRTVPVKATAKLSVDVAPSA